MNHHKHRGDDGSGANKRKHAVPKKLASGKKSRRESTQVTEGKEGSDFSHQVSNSALCMLQEVTAKSTESNQSLWTQSHNADISKDNRTATQEAPTPEGEGVTFPEKLMELVMNETDKQALWWMPDGKRFAIHSKKFTNTILAKNFQGSKFESFTRKLARWGFKRLTSPDIPPQTFVFEHPYFQRSHPELAKEISGSKKKAPPPPPSSKDDEAPKNGVPRTAQSVQPVPAPAPWPTFGNQLHAAESGDNASASGLYDDMIRQALLQQNLAATSANARSCVLTNHLLARSVFNNLASSTDNEESPANLLPQQQEAFLAATMIAEQDRARALAAAAAVASRSATDVTSSLPSLSATNNLHRTLATGLPLPPFDQDNVDARLSSLLLQQQQHQHRQRQQSTLPPPAAGTASLDPLVRLYLQQQEANRQENLFVQQEMVRQEIRRREQQQRERDDWGRH